MIDQDLSEHERFEHAREWKRCGGGLKERCCAFLTFTAPGGFYCARGSSLEATIRERVGDSRFTAKRLPEEPWPQCQLAEPS